MDRRKVIAAVIATSAVLLGTRTLAQRQKDLRRIGFLNGGSPGAFASFLTAFLSGLREAGYVDGRNVAIEYRWADGEYDRLPAMAADLNARPLDVVVASGGLPSALAAKRVITTIPVVFITGGDPIKTGLVRELSRPGGNVTGIANFALALDSKRFELLYKLIPKASIVAILTNPRSPNIDLQVKEFHTAARTRGLRSNILNAANESEIDAAFAALTKRRPDALIVGADPFFNSRRDQIVALAARHRIPAIYEFREFVVAGGLMSYGANLADLYRQAGLYAGRILKGERPGDLPVQQPTKFELVISRKAAKALGLVIPDELLLRADEVIE